ncbi:MAG: hypothetical protein ACWGOX_07305, partial [Desulforhopalus sp.]
MQKQKIYIHGLFVTLCLLLGYYFLVANLAVVKLDVTTDHRTIFKIYYQEGGSGWSEKNMSAVVIHPGRRSYTLRLTDLSKVSALRIDTSEKPATVTVHSLVIDQHGYAPLRLDAKSEFEKLQPGGGIADFVVGAEGFTVTPATNDPQLILTLDRLQKRATPIEDAVRVSAIVLFSFFLASLCHDFFYHYRFVVAMALAALSLVVVMAGISLYNVHPDEAVHIQAARYYEDHNLPPKVGDPDIVHTYSKYGVSRLHSGEIAYFIAGK